MYAFVHHQIANFPEIRGSWITRWEEHRLYRRARRRAKSSNIRMCPNCQVPIQKTDGCDHMYCTSCNRGFLWSRAVPWRGMLRPSDNDLTGHLRFCPHCKRPNEKLHSLSDARCIRCHKDFDWESALLVPLLPSQNLPPSSSTSSSFSNAQSSNNGSGIGGRKYPLAELNLVVQNCLNHHQRLLNESDAEDDVDEVLCCGVCMTRRKSFALECGHVFCEYCVVQILQERPVCPVDRVHITAAPIRVFI